MTAIALFVKPMPRPYHIVAPGFTVMSAGIRVLHELHRLLRERGYESTISCDTPAPEKEETVAVYPEIVAGNPLGFKHVARWDLCYPVHKYPPSEKVFYYMDEYHNDRSQAIARLAIFFTEDYFCLPPEGTTRDTDCYFLGKGPVNINTEGLVEVTGFSRPDLAALFKRSRCFFTCGHTSLSREALLCGCEVVYCDNLPDRKPLPNREQMKQMQAEDLARFIELTQGDWMPFTPDNRGINPGWESWVR